ncbi:growth arrest and DNA damage-inducible proteins-interacting protein 1 [Mugil cephalus]|uniref:growth arrest and DNA damage-inducible proteins-interacting protein 1 n=1 Tax=Mugil cephalus TaxID=48193 RepID=UPI001FB7DAE5|nr:growth arrest and DNA damage-inducible proteins-interacting protein 1 [Mugil cephalus]
MAASMLCRRTTALCRTLKGFSPSTTALFANSQCPLQLQTASYNPRPLRVNIRDPYIPDKNSEKTPEWQKTARHDRKLFGRYGSASGIDPASLWPSHEELDEIIAEEKEWNPPLKVMLKNIEAREKEETAKRLAKEKLIAANMAKMPKLIADWRREKREAKLKQKAEKERRRMLLAKARERFGYMVDHRSHKFKEMMAEVEKDEKKMRKQMKRRLKEEQVAGDDAPPAASSSSSS